MKPLLGLTVLDLSRLLPGPYLTRILADLGADVIKVEGADGDLTRHIPPLLPQPEQPGAGFAALNFNKRSVVLDLKAALGVEVLLAMARRADVVVESFRPGVLERLGLGLGALQAVNPRLILCSISGYGQDGPLRHVPGHDLNYLARAGILGLCGPAGAPPAVPGVQMADITSALSAATGILAALLERHTTQRGRHVDVSITRSAMALLAMELPRRTAGEPEPRGAGLLSGGVPCYRIYTTRDGRHMALAALEPKFFAAFCARAGCPELALQGLSTGPEGEAVVATLQTLFGSRTQAEWVALMEGAGACCEPVRDPEEAMQDAALGQQVVRWGPAMGLVSDVGLATVAPLQAQVPRLGEHGAEVARDLQVDPELVRRAAEAGAFWLGNGTSAA